MLDQVLFRKNHILSLSHQMESVAPDLWAAIQGIVAMR